MKMNQIIRDKRKELGLTQEQIADYLQVSTPAVNKWEKGTSYPDITLLPALARLLNTDLNTLLSFKEDLTTQEIALFVNHLSECGQQDGFEAAWTLGMNKISEFPTCFPLILNTALALDGLNILGKKAQKDSKARAASIEALYERVLASDDPLLRNQAQSLLISKYIGRKEYAKAEALLNELPDTACVDKKQQQVNLYIACGRLPEAAKLEEEKLLTAASNLHGILISLMEIALKENRDEDAQYIADTAQKAAQLLDLWEYTSYVSHFQLHYAKKNRIKCLQTLLPMLRALSKKWNLNDSPLYRHVKVKENDDSFAESFRHTLLASIEEDADAAFLKDAPEIKCLKDEL